MKQQYILPNTYATEKDRYQTYRAVIRKEQPVARRIIKGEYSYRYVADTSIGAIFFEIMCKGIETSFKETHPAHELLLYIKI